MENSESPAAKLPCTVATVVNWEEANGSDVAGSSSASRNRKAEEDRRLMPPPPPRKPVGDVKGKRSIPPEEAERQAKYAKLAEWRKLCADIEEGTSAELLPARMERVQVLTAELQSMGVELERERYEEQEQEQPQVDYQEAPGSQAFIKRIAQEVVDKLATEQESPGAVLMRAMLVVEHIGVLDCLSALYNAGEAGQMAAEHRAGDALAKLLRADESHEAMVQTWDLHALCCSDAGGGLTGVSALDTLADILKLCMRDSKQQLAAWCMEQMAPFRRAPGCLGASALQLLAVTRCAARQTLGNVLCNL